MKSKEEILELLKNEVDKDKQLALLNMLVCVEAKMLQEQTETLRKEVEAHKVNSDKVGMLNEFCQRERIGKTGDSVTQAVMHEIVNLRKEVERLKELIKDLHDRNLITKADREMTWIAFCKHHNL